MLAAGAIALAATRDHVEAIPLFYTPGFMQSRRYSLAVTSRVIIEPLPEQLRPLALPVLERVDG